MTSALHQCRAHGGSVRQFIVDDKGCVLILVFGLDASLEAASQAVRTTVELLRSLEQQGVRACAGVASGRCYCGVIGNDVRCEYTVAGDVVNLAARLMGR